MASPFYDSWFLLKRRSDTAHIEDERRLEQRPGYPSFHISQAKKPDFVRNPSGPGFYEDTPRATLMTDESYEAPSETQLQSVKEGNVKHPLNFETDKFFNQSPEIYSGDDSRFTVKTGHPMEIAFRLLKEIPFQNNYDEDPPGMRPPPVEFPPPGMESTPVPALLQGRKPSNIVHSSGRLPVTREDIERMMQENPRGQDPLGPLPPSPSASPARPPVRPELAAKFNFPLTGRQFETPQTADRRMEMEDANRGFDEY